MSVLGWFPFVTADRPEHSNPVADPGEGPGGRAPDLGIEVFSFSMTDLAMVWPARF